ncbi:hypothetical protein LQ757_13340 [Agromyces sp. SYSU K20354]|uniref:hypothetical protein n=1 Tax=Agromyces cavernae TaxID=2898659 RepID=UPI001E4F1AC4|nr:hypothetical protein [Agromyces cavernae]MCD2443262.1 hypothetical protein [Agromyces cavernae]
MPPLVSDSAPAPAVASGRPVPVFPRDGRLIGLVGTRLAGAAAITAGALSIIIGVLQFLFPQDEDPAIDPRTRVILAMFTVSLWALAVLFLGLARHARSSWGAVTAATGTVLLTVGTITSAVNGIDLEFFPAVAMLANALWLVGAIALCVSLVRARRVSLWIALPLPFVQVPLLFFSQVGGGVPAGLFLAAVGLALLAGGIDARARRLARRAG